jgi:hypothetical protein
MKSKGIIHLPTHFTTVEDLEMEVQLQSFLALVSGQLYTTAAVTY